MEEDRRKEDQLKVAMKEALKESINDWLDEKYRAFGKYTLWGIVAFVVSVIAHVLLFAHAKDLKVIADAAIEQLAR